ncbi:MAG: PilZ domain-containing protein [Nitrospirae bacterium]|nr:PilZ domain-containing protein [Nitrospirota bacterium]MBI3595418.1 PilZ domain-containing protein [Nitrospirota bacterium]
MAGFSGSVLYHRRAHPRANLELQADFRILLSDTPTEDQRQKAKTETLGGGGLMFVSPIQLSLGNRLEMRLFYMTFVLEFVAEVVWIEQLVGNETEEFKCGLRYVDIADGDLAYIHYILYSNQESIEG